MSPECAMATMAQAGKYLSFRLGGQEYGLEILKVQEIVGAVGITPMPGSPDHVRGWISLRGCDLPVIQLRDLFGLKDVQESEKNCVIIAQVPLQGSQTRVGLLVDEVCEVMNITDDLIQFPPSMAGGMEGPDFINGMAQMADRDVILLEIEDFFSEEELKAVVMMDD